MQVSTTYTGWDDASATVVIAGYVSGAIEDGGTCTATLTKGGTTLTAEAEGIADASTTSCGQLAVSGASAGTWSAVLSYQSGASAGKSAPVSVVVP